MDQLSAMRSFVEVVDRGGFALAGRSLGLSGPMVGNHIRSIEARLGGRLLNRTTRAQHLTELGRAYLARCRTVLAEIDAAEADAAELTTTPRGSLRVTAPHAIGLAFLPSVIARFLQDHPGVSVDLRLDDQRLDLLVERFDVAIRSGFLEDAGLITRSLGMVDMVVCASPDYLARRGEPTTLGELRGHDCLDFGESSTPGIWRFDTASGVVDVPVSGRFRANSGGTLCQVALAGCGIILQPYMTVRKEVETGSLKALLTNHRPERRPLQLLTHPDRQPTPKLRSFVDAVV
ncbi:MAG: LysR family transcriptional regulator, partial [Janthinobacterium lividum]